MLHVAMCVVSLATVIDADAVHSMENGSSVCYGDLGCFSNTGAFQSLYRPISFLPESPDSINPKFFLYTRESPSSPVRLHAGDLETLKNSTFDGARPTKIIVHGFIDNTMIAPWIRSTKQEFLRQGDYNVIIVDWGEGSLALYTQATANTRVVGAMIAQLITFLQNTTGACPEDMHIIGHSLGAHTAGYAGQRLQYLGRITGLDPAEPYFQNMDEVVRLDPSDALFVDVIHSDAGSFYSTELGLGMSQACGHVDFYVNGGDDQPGCQQGPLSHLMQLGLLPGTRHAVACDHMRACHLFKESINSKCPFKAYRCDSEDAFNNGSCLPCSGEACRFLGLHADRVQPTRAAASNKHYLKTGSSSSFCRTRDSVTHSHVRASDAFRELISNECPSEPHHCESEDRFNNGSCLPPSSEASRCLRVHEDGVQPVRAAPAKYYLKTGSRSPYCRYHYKVSLTFSKAHGAREERGSMYVTVHGSTGTIQETLLTKDAMYIQPGQTYSYILTSPIEIGVVRDVIFRWVHDSSMLDIGSWNLFGLRHPRVFIDNVQVVSGEDDRSVQLCGHGIGVETNHPTRIAGAC